MLALELKHFLDDHHIKYKKIDHTPTYTAQETAASAHISGRALAKAVIVKLDDKLAMVLEPANKKVDFKLLKKTAAANQAELASESEFEARFKDCELGAMPALGNIWDMDVYIDKRLLGADEIAFNGGSHSELVLMSYKDFAKWAHPKVLAQ